ncbi:MAG: CsbD family protein [Acidimicrobiia bacterium]
MGSQTDDMKGRAKEAVGDLTDNDDLKREGKTDQFGADIKEKAEQAKDKADEMVDKAKEKFDR